jgi:multiple sugar transport system substrate-binding protein
MSRLAYVFLAAALIIAPLGAQAADLVVWWEKGFYAQEEEAVRETIAAFEKDGKQVELVFYSNAELPDALEAALEAGQAPDFAFGFRMVDYLSEWAFR